MSRACEMALGEMDYVRKNCIGCLFRHILPVIIIERFTEMALSCYRDKNDFNMFLTKCGQKITSCMSVLPFAFKHTFKMAISDQILFIYANFCFKIGAICSWYCLYFVEFEWLCCWGCQA